MERAPNWGSLLNHTGQGAIMWITSVWKKYSDGNDLTVLHRWPDGTIRKKGKSKETGKYGFCRTGRRKDKEENASQPLGKKYEKPAFSLEKKNVKNPNLSCSRNKETEIDM